MAVQYDFVSGVDLSALSSVTQAQLMQAINRLAPLANIGGVIYGPVANFDDVGDTFMTDNPRCARYLLIDTTASPYTLKTWSGTAWVSSTVGTGAINAAAQITDNIITIAKLAPGAGNARKVLRVNTPGSTAFELIAPASVFTTNEIPVSHLVNGAAGQHLIADAGGTPTWTTYNAQDEISALPVARLAKASTEQRLIITKSDAVKWAVADDALNDFLTAGSNTAGINLSKLCNNSLAANTLVCSNGSNIIGGTSKFNLFSANAIAGPSSDTLANQAVTVQTAVVALSAIPNMMVPYVKCIGADANTGYADGDFLNLSNIAQDSAGRNSVCTFWASYSGGNVTFNWQIAAGVPYILKKDGSAWVNTGTLTNFRFKVMYIPAF
jgi:hypothetical protein